MRSNLPVTQNEVQLTDSTMIVSKTDLKGVITYVNHDFLAISGYSEAELLGQPHNIVRHPDMPEEGFADLWRDLAAGRPWTGLVKNRCKNGDFYWVMANAAPIMENGGIVGYMSVRRRASREAIAAHDGVYRLFRDGKQGNLRIRHGQAVKGAESVFARLNLTGRMGLILGGLGAIVLAVMAFAMLSLSATRQNVVVLHEYRMEPIQIVGRIGKLMADNRALVLLGLQHDPASPSAKLHDHPINLHTDAIGKNAAEITELWERYGKLIRTDDHRKMADDYAAARKIYVEEGLKPSRQAQLAGNFVLANDILLKKVNPAYAVVSEKADALYRFHSEHASQEVIESGERYRSTFISLIAALLALIGIGIFASIRLIGGIRKPVDAAISTFKNIVQGNYSNVIDTARNDELGKLNQALQTMQTYMGFETAEMKRQSDENLRIRIALDNVSTGVMIADAGRTIIYANPSVQKILKGAESDLREALPNFNADKLIGENIDGFHKDPRHQAGMLAGLAKSYTAQLTIGTRRMQVTASPVINSRNERLGSVAEWLDRTEEFKIEEDKKRTADEMARIKIALDNVSTGVMIANAEREIIYANGSVIRILKEGEAEIRKVLPAFNAERLIGVNIDSFHKNPKHQADMLATLNRAYTATLKIGSRHMVVTANPVINTQNERLGSVAEWLDRTAEVRVEEEVAGVVQAAMLGDFDTRLGLDGKEGFFKALAEGLNRLSETTSTGLNDVARVLKSVAQGDLTETIDADYSGIFGQLKDDTNSTVERLREVIGRIKDASEAIDVAAKEISAGNLDLSGRTEEQASSLEETASSMEELNSTVKQNADNADNANKLARASNDIAVKSGQMVQQIVTTMTGISESSKKIADIIGVIDSIAFQTNILALNAAVEAARAGEQGRGFAVVATEVRNLAQRSATAAKEIKELIVESGAKVEAGTRLVGQAGQSMTEVVSSFQQVTTLVTDIASASREQSGGIEQVTQAVGQMDEVTQQNAALVEESAAAAESLEEQAAALVQSVAMFKLAEGDGDTQYRPPAVSRNQPAKRLATTPARTPLRKAASTMKKLPPANTAAGPDEEWEEF